MTENTDDKWLFVSRCIDDLAKQSDRFDAARDQMMIAPESPLVDPFWQTSEALIQSLSMLVNDNFETLSWFVFECDFGRDPKEAGKEGTTKLIDSHEKLRWIIELDSEA